MRTGADISHHQSSFDAGRYYASGEDFLIHKATEGSSFTDPDFTGRWRACAGRPRAAYHFARPGGAGVDRQADHFIAVLQQAGWRQGDSWALDLEDAGGAGPATLVAWADRWCSRIRTAFGGRGLFYSYIPFIRDQMGDPGRIPGGCLGWIARYRTDSPWAPPHPRPAGWPLIPDVWQCSNGQVGCVHQVASVGRCDYNHMTDAAFAALFEAEEDDMTSDEHAALFEVKSDVNRILQALSVVDAGVAVNQDTAFQRVYDGVKEARNLPAPTAAEIAAAVVATLPSGSVDAAVVRAACEDAVRAVFADAATP